MRNHPAILAKLALVLVPMIFAPLAAHAQLKLRDDVTSPTLQNFRPLPAPDAAFSAQLEPLVKAAKLDEMTPAKDNADKEDEWSSICVVDLRPASGPKVGVWKGDNFVYPASTYKMYVLGEAIRQVTAGEHKLDDELTVSTKNDRDSGHLKAGQVVTLSEVLRLMAQYSDNTAANMAIDTVDRQRASMLLRAMGLKGSDITRKYLPRDREDEGYAKVPGTVTCALHQATFLYAVETGAIGGGNGRGLIKSYLAMCETGKERFRAGIPATATLFHKTGEWANFTAEAALVEDGKLRYIICVMTAMPEEKAAPRMADFAKRVHEMLAAQ